MDQKLCKNFIHGGGGGRAGINQIVLLFLNSLLTGSSLEAQRFMHPLDPTLDQRCVRLPPVRGCFARRLSSNFLDTVPYPHSGQRPCKLSLGGPALRRWLHHQRRAWTPLPSLLSRLVINRQWQIMNIYSKVFTLSCLHGSEVVQKLHPWSAISQKEQGRELAALEKGQKLSTRQLCGLCCRR